MDSLPEQLVAEFLREYRASGVYLRDNISRLTELATSENSETAETATRAVFTLLVERLGDSFEPAAVSLYNRAFAQVIHLCRAGAHAEGLDRSLARFGLRSEQDLTARAEKLRQAIRISASEKSDGVRRVIVLSRVTLGADVAITSVILERMKRSFPQAEIVLLGGIKARELLGGDSRLTFRAAEYRRGGATIERLLNWTALVDSVGELTGDLEPSQYLIVDPDSRLTQLGLLPVTCGEPHAPLGSYLFFPSREYRSGTSSSLGELASCWLNQVLGEGPVNYPCVSVNSGDIELARELVTEIRRAGPRPIISINFGVGDNPMKRVGDEFETKLVARLIQNGSIVILDKGAGYEEAQRVQAIVNRVSGIERDIRRLQSLELTEDNWSLEVADKDLLVLNGRVGILAALIGESDLYVGYDSAGQHIAAALGVPCIDVFAGFTSERFVDRWRPSGRSETRVIKVDTLGGNVDQTAVLSETLRHAAELLKNSRR